MTTSRFFLLAFAIVALLILRQFLQPYPMPASQVISPPALPDFSDGLGYDVLAAINEHNIWDEKRESLQPELSGEEADAATGGAAGAKGGVEAPPADVSWRLVGVSQEGMQQLAVIDSQQGMRSYQVGENLPDGATITRIMPFGIQIKRLGEDEKVYLFGKQ